MLFLFTVVTMRCQADQVCTTPREGDCFLAGCRQWCSQTYNGNGHCEAYGNPSSPKYKCICVHKC